MPKISVFRTLNSHHLISPVRETFQSKPIILSMPILSKAMVAYILICLSLLLTACLVPPSDEAQVTPESDSIEAVAADAALAPVELAIPALELDVPVAPMGWRVTEVNGERTTQWTVPLTEAGWHVNSAGAGGQGNVVISGHQVQGEAVFAQIALGEVAVDQDIALTDEEGRTFTYRVSEITDPIPLVGATAEESALANSYTEPSEDARLTLLTGWPADTTTHYVIVVAELVDAP